MKKIVLSWMLIFGMIAVFNQAWASTATVKATAVRIRESASTDSNIITNLYEKDEVEILEENGEWYKVRYEGKEGYAKAEYFEKKAEEPESVSSQPEEPQNPVPETPAETNSQPPEEQNVVPTPESVDTTNLEWNIGENITLQSTVKLRLIPNLTTNPKTEVAQNTSVTIEAKLGNWYKIATEASSGWLTKTKLAAKSASVEQLPTEPEQPTEPTVPENTAPPETPSPEQPAENLSEQQPETPNETTMNKTAVVIVETARVRESASTNATIIDVLDEDDVVTIIGEEGNFYKITTPKKKEGYISKTLVKEKEVTSRSSMEERTTPENQVAESKEGTAASQKEVVQFAKQYLGYSYVLGCSSPETGFDCSGFTRYVFGHFGYKLGRVAADQTSLGAVVERANLQMGDLLLFYDDGKTKIGHCGIYIEGGQFIHSANPKRGVVIDNMNTNSYYSQRFVTARRIVQ